MSSCNKTKETGVLYNLIVLRRNIHRPGDGRIAVRSKRARVIEDVGDNVGMSTIMDHVSAAADWDYEVAHDCCRETMCRSDLPRSKLQVLLYHE